MNSRERIRYMRLLVFFDLPVDTASQRKEYRRFRKFLVKEGYLMLQQSVYVKMLINDAKTAYALQNLKKNRPISGLVQALKVTEKQFSTMSYITGNRMNYDEVDTMEEFVVL